MARDQRYYTVFKDRRAGNWNRDFQKGKFNATVMEVAFANSPQYDAYDHQVLLNTANEKLVPKAAAQVGEIKDFPKGVNFDYSGTDASGPPAYKDVKQKILGKVNDAVSSPYTPNIISPGPENGVKPTEVAPKSEEVLSKYPDKVARVINPSETSGIIGKQVKLGEKLGLGTSNTPSRGTQIDG